MNEQRISRRKFLQWSAGVAGMAALAACAPPAAAPAAAPAGGEAAAPAAAPAAEMITLTTGHAWEAAFQPHQAEFDRLYSESHPGVTVEMTNNTWGDHQKVVPTWAAANTLPDIVYVHGSRAFPWAFEGITIPTQDYIASDEAFDVASIWEESLSLYRFRGVQHAIPYDHGPLILGYNKNMFDEAGIAYPDASWTFDKMREVAAQLTKTDGDVPQWGWSGSYPNFGNTGYGPSISGWGATLLNDEETELLLDSAEARTAIQFWMDMIHVDKSAPTPAESEAFEQGAWISGRVGMTPAASWNAPTFTKFCPFTWDVAPLPAGPVKRSTGSFGSGYGITKDTKHPDAAWEYMSAYLSEEGMIYMWGDTGRGSPARESGYRAWMASAVAPEHAEFFIDALNEYALTGRPYQTLAAAELGDITGRQAGLLRSGETDVETAINAIMAEGQPVLDAATARLAG